MASAPFINNRNNVYVPIPLCCGVMIMMRPNAIFSCYLVPLLLSLKEDVSSCFKILPNSIHGLIRRTRIWVNGDGYPMGDHRSPKILKHMTTHHYVDWLHWARDRPDKVQGIEIYSAKDYLQMRKHWNGAGGLLLHELCHLIHQNVFGLDCLRIQRLYGMAVHSKRYDCVVRRDWAGKRRSKDLAYCMVDHKEFFAELSVAYWSRGYMDLDQACRDDVMACSPPLMHEEVAEQTDQLNGSGVTRRLFGGALPVECHCNKFYPFTSGQLEYSDPEMYREFESLWQLVEGWTDPELEKRTCVFSSRKNVLSAGCIVEPLQSMESPDDTVQQIKYQVLDTVDL